MTIMEGIMKIKKTFSSENGAYKYWRYLTTQGLDARIKSIYIPWEQSEEWIVWTA